MTIIKTKIILSQVTTTVQFLFSVMTPLIKAEFPEPHILHTSNSISSAIISNCDSITYCIQYIQYILSIYSKQYIHSIHILSMLLTVYMDKIILSTTLSALMYKLHILI